ncbi:diguanylate cyclase [Rummeliibacillus pycnus]
MSNFDNVTPEYVLESKKRCAKRGLDSKIVPTPQKISNAELNQKLADYTKIFEVVNFFIDKFFQMVNGIPILLVISDDESTILETKGDSAIKSQVEKLGFQPGVKFTEEQNGTNSVSLALALNQPIQLIGTQHYHDFLQSTACYTIPFEFGINKGTISIMTLVEYQSPLLLSMLASVVSAIERELLLKEKNKQLNILNQIVTESTKNGIIQTDRSGNITEFNHCAEELIGWKKEDIVGKGIEHTHPLEKYLYHILKTENDFSDVEMTIINEKTNKKTICLFDGMPLYNQNGDLTGAFGQLKDITERYEAEAQINYLAYHDDLTGLPNRRFFKTALNAELLKAKDQKEMLAVFLLDLDRFKNINDTLGHEKGDTLLCEVSKRLTAYLPGNATLFRMGGMNSPLS